MTLENEAAPTTSAKPETAAWRFPAGHGFGIIGDRNARPGSPIAGLASAGVWRRSHRPSDVDIVRGQG